MYSRMEQNKVLTISFERTFALNKIKTSAWVDFGHVLGNATEGTDRISFLSDQNNVFQTTFAFSLVRLITNLQRLFKLKEG